jgi:Family of unknown function (DUF6328)
MELEAKFKTALDESRLLILGAQVLFGFLFQGVFQEAFASLPYFAKAMQCCGLLSMSLAVALLIAPSLHHQIAYKGETVSRAISEASLLAILSLLPLTAGLGMAASVVFEHLYGRAAALLAGITFTATGLGLFYGMALLLRERRSSQMPSKQELTPLKTKIEHMLTEARVIIPGGQALLGFQLVATLTKAFSELPASVQNVHVAGLCAVALSVMLLMTPAALHRIAYAGEDNKKFFRIGSRMVVVASIPLAAGTAADIYVVFMKVFETEGIALTAGVCAAVLMLALWFVFPLGISDATERDR